MLKKKMHIWIKKRKTLIIKMAFILRNDHILLFEKGNKNFIKLKLIIK